MNARVVVDSKLSAVDKAMTILGVLLAPGEPMRLSELSRRTGLAKSTVHRLLATLSEHNMITQRDGRYLPVTRLCGPERWVDARFLKLLRAESPPFLVDLHHLTGAQASVCVLAGEQVHVVNEIHGHRAAPGLAGETDAAGKVLAAYSADDANRISFAEIERIRSAGIAYSRDGATGRVTAVAAPVFDAAFPQPAALAISGQPGWHTVDLSAEALRRVAYAFTRRITSCTVRLRQGA